MPGLVRHVMILHEQEVDHQTDDLARRKMLPAVSFDCSEKRRISSSKIEPMTWLDTHPQVYLGEAADHLVQQVGLVEFLNLLGFKRSIKISRALSEKPLI